MPKPIVTVDGRLDLSQINAAMLRAKQGVGALKPVWQKLRKPFRADQREHSKNERDETAKWPPRSAITESRRKRRVRKARRGKQTAAMKMISPKPTKRRLATPKRLLGRMPSAFKFEMGNLFMRGVHRIAWAIAHQTGARVGRGRKVKLPRRRFFYIGRGFASLVAKEIGAHVKTRWDKK